MKTLLSSKGNRNSYSPQDKKINSNLLTLAAVFLLLIFPIACKDYEAITPPIVKQAKTEAEKKLLGDAVLHFSAELETQSWGEVVDKSDLIPGRESMLKGLQTMHVSRVKQIFQLFPDGTVRMEITKLKPKYHTEPTIIYSTPRDPKEQVATRWVMTNDKIMVYDQSGNQINDISNNLPLMTGLVSALSKDCKNDKRDVTLLPLLLMSGDATEILSACVQQQLNEDEDASISYRDGLMFIKRKISSLSVMGQKEGIMPIVNGHPASNRYVPYTIQTAAYIRKKLHNTVNMPYQIVAAANYRYDEQLFDTDSLPPISDPKEDAKMLQENLKELEKTQTAHDYSQDNTVTVVDPENGTILGSYTENPEGTSILETSRFDFIEDTKDINRVHHERYKIDLVSGASVTENTNTQYDNVNVLTKD